MLTLGLPGGHGSSDAMLLGRQPPMLPPAGSASGASGDTAAVISAREALANADSQLATDQRDHDASCASVDKTLVTKDQAALAQAQAAASLDIML